MSKLITNKFKSLPSVSINSFINNTRKKYISTTQGKKPEKASETEWWSRIPDYYRSGELSQGEFNQFFSDGFIIRRNIIPQKLLDDVDSDLDKIVDGIANRLYEAGKIKNLYKDKTHKQRLAYLEKEFKDISVLVHKNGVLPKSMQELWSDRRLLNICQQLLGPKADIGGHPVWNVRSKVPKNDRSTVPFHQDNAYVSKDCWHTLTVTAWIPLVDVNEKNGCLQVIKTAQNSGRTVEHKGCWKDTWYVDVEEEVIRRELGIDTKANLVTCVMNRGDILLFSNLLPHRSLDNFSDAVRWSLDLRWQEFDQPNGFIKSNILMKRHVDDNYKPDWEEWAKQDRQKLQIHKAEEDPFNTIIHGPWMDQWHVSHENKHTLARKEYLKQIGDKPLF